ncbi:rhomboid-related protein 4 [Bombina bombina]|uniref:rhomboid-related protein 4 n=1 Tax=Bombina bombina TaxID=8345 RepID=UPI00235A931A|nr:rhomboid-related protein 4 [Bombina bombina]XP_053565999.1 rhomboid-related protein 4 [Bombina bombina]XP_053566000.1 rhomboid-related protein 4 [Bombina bombina]XP_053566002.1 rhomboid-related protein 4 [Bombina bombina]XP_053566003.1 rhomboid-related protein 4 [Bombina bombina]XP_053566004.1 rhomboid-related protein 4 [Bombina bombina]
MQRRQRGVNTGLLLLFAQIYQFGLNNIPPVTLATLAVNIYLFLNPLKPLHYVCISVHEGYYRSDWQRLLLSPFHHVDDWHLYFNMVSLLWKGTKLEGSLGSLLFAMIIAVFSQLIGVVYVILELMLAEFMDDPSYKIQCAVGFSGVLFALKVLNNHYHPGGSSNVFGFHVSNRYACWVELVAIHIASPGTSFVGHLSGILIGLLYTQGPLKTVLTRAAALFTESSPGRQRNFRYSGATGYQNYEQNNSPGTYDPYTGGLNEHEQLQRAIRESLNERGGQGRTQQNTHWSPPEQLSAEEIRRRRLRRY